MHSGKTALSDVIHLSTWGKRFGGIRRRRLEVRLPGSRILRLIISYFSLQGRNRRTTSLHDRSVTGNRIPSQRHTFCPGSKQTWGTPYETIGIKKNRKCIHEDLSSGLYLKRSRERNILEVTNSDSVGQLPILTIDLLSLRDWKFTEYDLRIDS